MRGAELVALQFAKALTKGCDFMKNTRSTLFVCILHVAISSFELSFFLEAPPNDRGLSITFNIIWSWDRSKLLLTECVNARSPRISEEQSGKGGTASIKFDLSCNKSPQCADSDARTKFTWEI